MMDAKHFLVVGGSSGIGLEIVKTLHEKGNEVYVGSRTNDQLAELAVVNHSKKIKSRSVGCLIQHGGCKSGHAISCLRRRGQSGCGGTYAIIGR